jgi:hypothetical protein
MGGCLSSYRELMENGAKPRTDGSKAEESSPIGAQSELAVTKLIKQYNFLLRIAGCVLTYFWARAAVQLGPLVAGDRDFGWVAPHWTSLLIWLPAIAAFWASGIGMTLLCLIAAMMVGIVGWVAVTIVKTIIAFVITGDRFAYLWMPI